MGGSGDYFDHADTVIQMAAFEARDVTGPAHEIARSHRTGRREEGGAGLARAEPRQLDPRSLDPERKPGRRKIQARGVDTLVFGRSDIDLRAVEQLEDPSQLRAIGWILARLSERRDARIEAIDLLLFGPKRFYGQNPVEGFGHDIQRDVFLAQFPAQSFLQPSSQDHSGKNDQRHEHDQHH